MEKEKLIVGLKFCGHCRMQKNMSEMISKLRKSNSSFTFSPFLEFSNPDVLLVLNACPAACAAIPPFPGQTIMVTPTSIDSWPQIPSLLETEIQRRLQEIYNSKYRRNS